MGTWNGVHTLPAHCRMITQGTGARGALGAANQWICYWIHFHMLNNCHYKGRECFWKLILLAGFSHRNALGLSESWKKSIKMWSIYGWYQSSTESTESVMNGLLLIDYRSTHMEPVVYSKCSQLIYPMWKKCIVMGSKTCSWGWWFVYKPFSCNGTFHLHLHSI